MCRPRDHIKRRATGDGEGHVLRAMCYVLCAMCDVPVLRAGATCRCYVPVLRAGATCHVLVLGARCEVLLRPLLELSVGHVGMALEGVGERYSLADLGEDADDGGCARFVDEELHGGGALRVRECG